MNTEDDHPSLQVTEPVRLEFERRRLIGDMETELEHFCATGRTIEEAKDGISFLIKSQKFIGRNRKG